MSQPVGVVVQPPTSALKASFPAPPWKVKLPTTAAVDHLMATSVFAPPTRAEVASMSRPVPPSAMLLPPVGGMTTSFERWPAAVSRLTDTSDAVPAFLAKRPLV